MNHEEQSHRKWTRYSGLFSCRIMSHQHMSEFVIGCIINISRGGLLLETNFKFGHGDRLTLISQHGHEIAGFNVGHDIHGTARWGQNGTSTPLDLYYVGVELDELLPGNKLADSYDIYCIECS